MQVPKRKPGKYAGVKKDLHITQAKLDELKEKLARLKQSHPAAAAEVRRLGELGDFSENAAYQIVKGKLRGLNQNILETEAQVNHAVIIEPNATGVVTLGSTVVIVINGIQHQYKILGSEETNPGKGVISRHSPIGYALMGHKAGDTVSFKQGAHSISCQIMEII
jgi:transcription elongation factor GreA